MSTGKDDKAKPAPPVEGKERDGPLYAIGGDAFMEEPRFGRDDAYEQVLDSIVERIQIGDKDEGVEALHELVQLVDRRQASEPRSRITEIETRQSIYLTASGTLTQFNGILAAAFATGLATLELSTVKFVVAAALVLHVLAAFVLCWAARPVTTKREPSPAMALMGQVTLVDHTFRNYRRGWRMTMLALAVTSVAGALFILHTFGIEIGGLLQTLSL